MDPTGTSVSSLYWHCQPQPCPLLTAPYPCPSHPPHLGPQDASGGAVRGSGVHRFPAQPSLLPGLQPVQHQGCLSLGVLQEAGDAPVDLKTQERCHHCSPATHPRAQPPCRFPGLSTLGGPEPLTWNSRSSQVSRGDGGGPSVFPDIWGQQGPVPTLPVSLLYPPLKAGLCPPSPKGSARVASVLSQCPGMDRAFPDNELSLATEAGGDWLALLLPFPVRKSLFNNHHKITNTGWWPGLGMGVTVGPPLEWRERSSTG